MNLIIFLYAQGITDVCIMDILYRLSTKEMTPKVKFKFEPGGFPETCTIFLFSWEESSWSSTIGLLGLLYVYYRFTPIKITQFFHI